MLEEEGALVPVEGEGGAVVGGDGGWVDVGVVDEGEGEANVHEIGVLEFAEMSVFFLQLTGLEEKVDEIERNVLLHCW